MATIKPGFKTALQQCETVVKDMGLLVHYTHNLDPFYKGDLDGKRIFIGDHLKAEEKLFNLIHLAGHSIQWNIDSLLRNLGSRLFLNPDDALLKKLQAYEWQANCYGLFLLHQAGIPYLDKWLTQKYITDMMYLTHFYKTGKKLKRITKVAREYSFNKKLRPIPIPNFTPLQATRTRNGIVISF